MPSLHFAKPYFPTYLYFYLSKGWRYILQFSDLHWGQIYLLLPLLCPSTGGGNGKISRVGSFLVPITVYGDTGQPMYRTFSYHACFTLPLQPLTRCQWEVSWLDPPFFLVLTNVRIRTGDKRQPLEKTLLYFSKLTHSIFPKHNSCNIQFFLPFVQCPQLSLP